MSCHKHSQGFMYHQRPGSLKNYRSSAPGSRPQTHQLYENNQNGVQPLAQQGSLRVSGPKGRQVEMPRSKVRPGAQPSKAGGAGCPPALPPLISSVCWKHKSIFSTTTSKERTLGTRDLAQRHVQHLPCPPELLLSAHRKPTLATWISSASN